MLRRLLICVVTAAVAHPAFAADEQLDELRQQLEALKHKVQQLEERLKKAEEEERKAAQRAPAEEKKIKQVAAKTYKLQRASRVDVGGAIRFQLSRKSRDRNDRATGGEIDLDTVRLNFDGKINDILFSGEYRFYSSARFIHHAWLAYDFTDRWQGRLGIQQVPFGILPYASHNFFFSSNYYLGLEDDYDSGLDFIYQRGGHELQLAFFKNDEYAGGNDFSRYSYDPLHVGGKITYTQTASGDTATAIAQQSIEEANTLNLRYAYTFGRNSAVASELGLSLQGGRLYNSTADRNGEHWAAAAHLNGDYGNWNLMLQLARYELNPAFDDNVVVSVADGGGGSQTVVVPIDDAIIGTGAYGFEYTMPAKAWTYLANLAYTQPVRFGPVTALRYYNDFTYVDKDDPRFGATIQNVLGMSISAGALFTYVDLVFGKNQPFTSPYVSSGGFGGAQLTDLGSDSADDWTTRFNINVGYYF